MKGFESLIVLEQRLQAYVILLLQFVWILDIHKNLVGDLMYLVNLFNRFVFPEPDLPTISSLYV